MADTEQIMFIIYTLSRKTKKISRLKDQHLNPHLSRTSLFMFNVLNIAWFVYSSYAAHKSILLIVLHICEFQIIFAGEKKITYVLDGLRMSKLLVFFLYLGELSL